MGAECGRPERRLVGGEEVDRPAQAVGFHQPAPLPEFRAHILTSRSGHAYANRELCGGHHLRVDTANCTDDLDEVGIWPRLQQGVLGEPPSPYLRPGERSHGPTPLVTLYVDTRAFYLLARWRCACMARLCYRSRRRSSARTYDRWHMERRG